MTADRVTITKWPANFTYDLEAYSTGADPRGADLETVATKRSARAMGEGVGEKLGTMARIIYGFHERDKFYISVALRHDIPAHALIS